MKYLDVRDSNISTVPEEIKALVKQNEVESYFADNPVCRVDKSLDCEPLCSKYCWIRDEPGNGFCDFRCNSKGCQNDGGDLNKNITYISVLLHLGSFIGGLTNVIRIKAHLRYRHTN